VSRSPLQNGFAAGFRGELIIREREILLLNHVVGGGDGFVHRGNDDCGSGADSDQSFDNERQQMFRDFYVQDLCMREHCSARLVPVGSWLRPGRSHVPL
jgi:hypothetical protein